MTVFLVDDDELILFVMRSMLDGEGYAIREFASPVKALRALDESPGLIVSDVSMPGLDGFELAARVAERLGPSPPRTLLVSGDAHVRRLQETPTSQVVGLIRKPFSSEKFRQVARLMASSRDRCPGTLRAVNFGQKCRPDAEPSDYADRLCPCRTPQYATCPVYDDHVGLPLRRWISC